MADIYQGELFGQPEPGSMGIAPPRRRRRRGPARTEAYARRTDKGTSKQAAKVVKLSAMEKMVYDIILKAPCTGGPMDGYTKDQVHALALGHERDSVGPRFSPLSDKGFIVVIGKRREKSGCAQTVYLDRARAEKRQAAYAAIDPGPPLSKRGN